MKRIDLGNLIAAASNVALFADKVEQVTGHLSDGETIELRLNAPGEHYTRSLAHCYSIADKFGLTATLAEAKRCRSAYGKLVGSGRFLIDRRLGREIVHCSHQLATSLGDELTKHHAYLVAPREGDLIDDGVNSFGSEIVNALAQIRTDVVDGARCRAFELWTALVMHMMRVAEVGVALLADHLGVARGKSWGETINNVIESLDRERKSKNDPELKRWASETATYLNFVKDAFRNPAMHPEVSFERDQAISIHDNTRAFMRALLARVAPQEVT